MNVTDIPTGILDTFRDGIVIPALPLALTANRTWDQKRQRALLRYYMDSGVGGLAVGVHSTQFEIHNPSVGLYEPILALASEEIDAWGAGSRVLKIAGVCGETRQAVAEAQIAREHGYHACLVSLGAMKNATLDELVQHCQAVAQCTPIIGFYLQPAAGGRVLSYEFWREFFEIDNVLGVKASPFNRYQTFDVARALCEAGRHEDVTLYTGNDDNIVVDLLSEYRIATSGGIRSIGIAGGLLGHWGVWTRKAVEMLEKIKADRRNQTIPSDMLTLANEVTDANAAVFDATNGFAGCIPGIHHVLHRQGLLVGTWCLNPDEQLSLGQAEEIDRVRTSYPHLIDDEFIQTNLARWLA